jgi:hypothetical protein
MLNTKTRITRIMVLGILTCTLQSPVNAGPGQSQPDAKRQAAIRQALVAHGFEAGKTWDQTQDIMREIARKHGWQTHYSPDARVLGCELHLGNVHFDPDVCAAPHDHLDGAQRKASKW